MNCASRARRNSGAEPPAERSTPKEAGTASCGDATWHFITCDGAMDLARRQTHVHQGERLKRASDDLWRCHSPGVRRALVVGERPHGRRRGGRRRRRRRTPIVLDGVPANPLARGQPGRAITLKLRAAGRQANDHAWDGHSRGSSVRRASHPYSCLLTVANAPPLGRVWA